MRNDQFWRSGFELPLLCGQDVMIEMRKDQGPAVDHNRGPGSVDRGQAHAPDLHARQKHVFWHDRRVEDASEHRGVYTEKCQP